MHHLFKVLGCVWLQVVAMFLVTLVFKSIKGLLSMLIFIVNWQVLLWHGLKSRAGLCMLLTWRIAQFVRHVHHRCLQIECENVQTFTVKMILKVPVISTTTKYIGTEINNTWKNVGIPRAHMAIAQYQPIALCWKLQITILWDLGLYWHETAYKSVVFYRLCCALAFSKTK